MAAKRLIKVASELSVGTHTIIDFLKTKGHEIENNPRVKITEEQYTLLADEFSAGVAIKQKADRISIGPTRNEPKPAPKPEPARVEPVVKKPAEEPKPEPTPVVEAPAQEVVEEKESTKISAPKIEGLKKIGKIDLSKATGKKKPAKKVVEEPVVEKEVAPAKPAEEPAGEVPKQVEQTKPTEKPEEKPVEAKGEKPNLPQDGVIRPQAEKLRGIKQVGSVDLSKFNKPKKKKEDEKKEGEGTTRRRRKRRSAASSTNTTNRPGARGKAGAGRGKRNEPKEVSKKDVEDQIKKTLARMQGSGKGKRQKIRRENRQEKRQQQAARQEGQENQKLQLTEFIAVGELANLLGASPSEIIKICMSLGHFVTLNQRLDAEVIEVIAAEFNTEIEFISAEEQLDLLDDQDDQDAPEDLSPRAPIVTVMGHVDHGKTSLLDYIRKANVTEGEAGGITQHIGAYEVKTQGGKQVTFLDTPGHEAFTAMRARGAKVTDVAIIIIAADDQIMPQSKEAISHAQAAGVPMVFAINKVDKDGAQPERIKQQLSEMNILVEDWGGTYQSQDISAKTGLGIPELIEKILLEAELLDLKANPNREAHGVVLEASLDKGRGYVTKILVQNGSLSIGDSFVSGGYSGRVKAMFNERNQPVKKAGPSQPVLVLGLDGAPQAGEKFKVMGSESEARQLATKRAQIDREQSSRASKRLSLEEIGRRLALGTFKELNLIVKGDFDGSIEALSDSLQKLSIETVQVNIVHKAVGQIIDSDILLASASDAIIIGFQVRPSSSARKLAEKEGVQIKTYSIIYKAIEEISAAIEGMLDPEEKEQVIGHVDIREVFKISKIGTVAGCYVTDGKVTRNSYVRLIRDGIVIYPVKEDVNVELGTLKRFKDDVKEVKNGFECGLTIKNYNDIKVGDQLEVYEIIEVAQTLK